MSNFLYKYGDHTHEVGEIVDFSWRHKPHMTARGRRDIAIYTITLQGRLLNCEADSWTTIRDKIHAIKEAYAYSNYHKFYVENPDGTESDYVLDPTTDADILSGPYLVDFIWPTGTPEEFVAKREFTIVLECIRAEVESEIIEYKETITHVGNCMPSWVFQNVLTALPRAYFTWDKTTQLIIQKGSSIGFDGYYCPGWLLGFETMGVPILNSAQFEHQERRIQVPGKPLHLGNDFVYYPANWTYVYESVVPQFKLPA